jgi:hypothetical protein
MTPVWSFCTMLKFNVIVSPCKFRVVPMSEQVYQVQKGVFLVFSLDAATGNLKCQNGKHSETHLKKGTQQIQISPGCQGFFLEHLATSNHSVRMNVDWDWDPHFPSCRRDQRNVQDPPESQQHEYPPG